MSCTAEVYDDLDSYPFAVECLSIVSKILGLTCLLTPGRHSLQNQWEESLRSIALILIVVSAISVRGIFNRTRAKYNRVVA